jgi:two-component system CheB/CheR fusion protein
MNPQPPSNGESQAKPEPKGEATSVDTTAVHGATVVGIGASAGGLAALKTFFEKVPPETGLTFVVVVHLLPIMKVTSPSCCSPIFGSP